MILVIGGAGYVGSHMTKLLRERNEAHLVLDNFEKGHRAAISGSKFVDADLRDTAAVRKVFASHDIEAVLHYAAYSLVGESTTQPSKYWSNNVTAMLGLLDIMQEFAVTKCVFSSSAAVYGAPDTTPIPEDATKRPTSPYGQTKLAMEMALEGYEAAYGIRSTRLRYFNAAGAALDASIGEDHRPESHLIPAAIRAAQGLQPPLTVFGTDYPTPDGTCVRDYVHVVDLANAHMLAIEKLRQGKPGVALNLGTGRGWSVREVLDTISRITNLPIPHTIGERRAGDPPSLVADPARAATHLGWTAQFPDLDEIVSHAWGWHHAHPNGYDT